MTHPSLVVALASDACALGLLREAIDHARMLDLDLVAVHVVPPSVPAVVARARIDRLVRRADPRGVRWRVRLTPPHDVPTAVLEVARDEAAEAIAVSTRSAPADEVDERWSAITEAIAREADRPVLLVRTGRCDTCEVSVCPAARPVPPGLTAPPARSPAAAQHRDLRDAAGL